MLSKINPVGGGDAPMAWSVTNTPFFKVYAQLACAALAAGRSVTPEQLKLGTEIVMQGAAEAGYADCAVSDANYHSSGAIFADADNGNT